LITSEIKTYNKKYLSEILSISNHQLGENYIDKSDFLESEKSKILISVFKTNVVGFSILKLLTPEEAFQKTLSKNNDLLQTFRSFDIIGFRAQTVVKVDFQKKKIGTQLIKTGNSWLNKKVKLAFSIVWENENQSISHILNKQGFEKQTILNDYWKEDSLKRKFICPVCGEPPCLCKAVLYTKHF
jgi:hypothetical protein